ncbi:MAG TPA: AAA family ATPase [Actinomycetota bacterium]|nr:AAA family ATPase [Actinomycetota bacterium]
MSERASASSASPVSSAAPRAKVASNAPKPVTPRTRIIAIANQKGGVGKSTTAVSLGAALADNGHRALVIDMDPQGNASTGMGIRHEARATTVYDVLASAAPIIDSIVPTGVTGLSAIPSTIDLAGAEIELVSQFSREAKLKKAIEPLRQEGAYDFIILDCPPSLGLLTVNALTAAEELIVPIQCEYYALEGLGQLLRNVGLVQQNINPQLRLSGIVMTMFDPRTKLSEQVVEEVQKYFGDLVYDVIIPRTVRLSEAPGFGQPITVYDPKSKGAECYRRLAVEVAERKPPSGPVPSFEDLPTVVLPAVAEQPRTAPSEPEAKPEVEPPPGERPEGARPVAAASAEPRTRAPKEPVTAARQSVPEPETVREPQPKAAPAAESATPPVAAESATPPVAAPAAVPKPRPQPAPKPRPKAGQESARPPSARPQATPAPARTARPSTPARRRPEPREPAVAELDEDLWEPPEPASVGDPTASDSDAPPTQEPRQTPQPRVVVIDEDADRGRVPEQASRPSSGIGATLEEEGKRPRRWRLFRKGGE